MNVNADLRVRNIWVTSVDVTMKTRARKAVLLHLREGLKNQIQEGWMRRTSFRGENSLLNNEHPTKIEDTNLSCEFGIIARCNGFEIASA